MSTLSGTLLFLYMAMLIGKRTTRFRLATITVLILFTLAEVGIVLYEMYTMPMPKI